MEFLFFRMIKNNLKKNILQYLYFVFSNVNLWQILDIYFMKMFDNQNIMYIYFHINISFISFSKIEPRIKAKSAHIIIANLIKT
jgi:hypothetical protein